MSNVYETCPVLENKQFLLRLIEEKDAKDLVKVYSDKNALPFFNSDNCNGDNFYNPTEEGMLEAIKYWLWEYSRKGFVRFTICDKERGEAVGTIEFFKRVSEDCYNGCGVLRLDVRSDYEKQEAITEILSIMIPKAYELFDCTTIITKAPIYAVERIEALQKNGFEKSEKPLTGGHDGKQYYDYWIQNQNTKKTVLFVILDQYADWEAAYLSSAIHMLGQGTHEVKTVSLTKNVVQSIGGFHAVPDYDIQSMPAEYEALILIGGMTWRNEAAQQIKPLVEKCFAKGRGLGGICDASAFLGTVGVLNDVNHTSNDLQDLKQWAGNSYTGEKKYQMEQAVSDGNIITANGTAALEFAKEVMLTLKIAPEEKIMEWYEFHKKGMYDAPMPEM